MCGIAGILGPNTQESAVKAMTDALSHRGPDGEGCFTSTFGTLGHRRLSIIDLSEAGKQPMHSASGRFVISFNGEIYNYKELRGELEREGVKFSSSSDTEVLIEAWEKWGEKCLERLLGMFAFALQDLKEGKTFLVRDRLGIKPLYYAEQDGKIFFASEIKALIAGGVKAKPNEHSIALFLTQGYYDHSSETFFEGVRMLPGGSLMEVKDGAHEIRTWWYLPANVEPVEHLKDQEVVDGFKALFQDSLRMHLRSDVPVGVNLSSGIDSLSLYYHLREVVDLKKLHVFSMGFADRAYDETADIEHLVKEHGVPFHRVEITPQDHIDFMPHTLQYLDQPFGGMSTIAYDKLMSEPRKHGVIVLLEGQGVDEMLAGYKYYLDLLDEDGTDAGPRYQDNTSFIRLNCLNKDWLASQQVQTPEFEAPFKNRLSNGLYRDTRFTKLPRVLRFNDQVSMAHSLELRVPYLDHRLVEFCFSLPNRFKIRDGVTKYLLRESVKGMVPEELRTKSKRPMSSPQTPWYKTVLKDAILKELEHPRMRKVPMLDADEIVAEFKRFLQNDQDQNSFFFWQAINLAYWYERFFV